MKTLLIGLSIALTSCGALFVPGNKPLPSENFPYHVKLDDNYELYWNFNDTHITFETHVKTNGYVGLGISTHGAMKGSDVVIGWVKDGTAHFADRHAEGHFMPAKDSSQDWTLLSATESGEFTTLKLLRRLDTCDSNDMAIKEGTTRVIYSYHPDDPSSDTSITYHGANRRGTKSLLLLDPPTIDKDSKPLPQDVKTVDFLNNNYRVPGRDTTYRKTVWKAPALTEKHHMIRYEPVIQKGHEHLVHHILIYFCPGDVSAYVGNAYDESSNHHPPRAVRECDSVYLAWAIGGQAFNYPEHVGQSLGTPEDPGYFVMETHYDNPDMRTDFVDNSGIRIFLTTELRKYDGGILEAGVNVDPYQIIPPYETNFTSTGYCAMECMSEALGDTQIHVYANLLHAHLIGVKLRTRHVRNGVELQPLQEDNNYDFDYQEQRMLKEERVLKKGDSLVVECEYDSTGRTSLTYGGLSSREEMCLSFLLYYPRIPLTRCLSRISYKIPHQFAGQDVFHIVQHLDWTDKNVREAFKKDIEQSQVTHACAGINGAYQYNWRVTSAPKINQKYQHPQVCPN